MSDNKSIRATARDYLEHRLFGNVWLNLLLVSLVAGLIAGAPSMIGSAISRVSVALMMSVGLLFSIASIAVSGPITYGLSRIYIKAVKGNKKADFNDIFCGFKEEFVESVLLGLLRGLFIFLWSLLLIVPGIIKAYSYSMASYIQQEAKDKTWRSCLDRSKELTDGYKGKLFQLDLSFIGWYILGFLCLGVGVLWVSVYHNVARAEFYEQLKKAKNADYTDEPSDEAFHVKEDVFSEEKQDAEPFAEFSEEKKAVEPFAEITEEPTDAPEKEDGSSEE